MAQKWEYSPYKQQCLCPNIFRKAGKWILAYSSCLCGLNAFTIKGKYPLLLITTIMEQAGTSQIFSKLDLKIGFNLLCIAKGDQRKRAFKTQYGLYDYTVMALGLTNALSVF